jgi:hypothetical protein
MLAIWHLRPALQRRFPLHRGLAKDWLGFFAWCCVDGVKDYAILRENRGFQDFLCSKVALPNLADLFRTCCLSSFHKGRFFVVALLSQT